MKRNRRLVPNSILWVTLSFMGEEGIQINFEFRCLILLIALAPFILSFVRELVLFEWFSRKSPRERKDLLNFLRLLNKRDR